MGVFTFLARFAFACQNCCPQNKKNKTSVKRTKTAVNQNALLLMTSKSSALAAFFHALLYTNYMDF